MRARPVAVSLASLVVAVSLGLVAWGLQARASLEPTLREILPETLARVDELTASPIPPPPFVDITAPTPAPDVPSPAADELIAPPPERFEGPSPAPQPLPQHASTPASGQPGVYGVFIGIDDYPGTSADLGYASEDAQTADLAVGSFGVPAPNRLMLRDGQASAGNIRAAVQWLVERAGPGSIAVFFYAGHVRDLGGGTEAMVGSDGAHVTDVALATLLAPIGADATWVVMASCYGGGFDEVLGPGRMLTGAAPAGQLAYENSSIRASYLVHHLFREGWLERRAGPSVQEAFTYAYNRITRDQPQRAPVQYDEIGYRLRMDAQSDPPGQSPTGAAMEAEHPEMDSSPGRDDDNDGCLLFC